MKTSERLKAAKEVLLSRGWYQGDYANSVTGEVCIAGALNVVEDGDPFCSEDVSYYSRSSAHHLIRCLVERRGYWGIEAFNDDPARTLEDILALLDQAIALSEVYESATKVDAVDPVGGRVTG